MGFLKDFDLSKALESAFDIGKDLVLGDVTKSGFEDPATGKYIDTSSKPKDGGFLGFIGKAATAYTAMQDSDEEEPFQMPEHEGYTAKRGYRQQQASLSTQRYTPTNRMYQDAILRRMRQVNFEKNLQRMTESTTVRPISRRRSPISAGKTTITRQTSVPSALSAKTTKTTKTA